MARITEPIPEPPNLLKSPYTTGESVTGFLERWFDAGISLPDALDRKTLRGDESKRIGYSLVLVTITGSIPRRLGGDATDEDLAIDKKRSRRVAHVLQQSLVTWSPKPPKVLVDEALKREGAQLEWSLFQEDHTIKVEASLRTIATWAIMNDDRLWGRSAVVALENELRWMYYAMRD
jgi:hypothetical protein